MTFDVLHVRRLTIMNNIPMSYIYKAILQVSRLIISCRSLSQSSSISRVEFGLSQPCFESMLLSDISVGIIQFASDHPSLRFDIPRFGIFLLRFLDPTGG